MQLTWQIGTLIGFGLVLTGSAQLVVKSVAIIAQKLNIANFTLSFLLLGILTSTPEIFVAIQSGIDGVPQLSMGNLVGGSILLMSLVMGVSSIFLGKINLDHTFTLREIILSSAVVAAPALVLLDGTMTRLDGVFLTGLYVFHALLLNKKQHILKHIERRVLKIHDAGYHKAMLFTGLLGMAIASTYMVDAAQSIMVFFHMPAFVFGLILLSFGTNLPEFALAFEAAIARRRTIAFGDLLGSAAANTLVLGLLAIVIPFSVGVRERLWFSLILLVLLCAYFVWALQSRRDITRKEGFGLLAFYGVFVAFELFFSV